MSGHMQCADRTHRARTVVFEPLEKRTFLSASIPAALQAVPIGSFDLVAAASYVGYPYPYIPSSEYPTANGLTPNQIRGAYGLGIYTAGTGSLSENNYVPGLLGGGIVFGPTKGDGTGQTIAIVDPYDDPTALSDLNNFSAQFGLPVFNGSGDPTFTKLNQSGETSPLPGTDPDGPYSTTDDISDWEVEESLDIEWAHVAAPMANIILFEANGASTGVRLLDNLCAAVQTAAKTGGVSTVSMSWSFPENEIPDEQSYDSDFTTPSTHNGGVTFLAAAGDYGAYVAASTTITPQYPASSPNVVAVGGTSLYPNGNSYGTETAWGNGTNSWNTIQNHGKGGGGGISAIESQPEYQKGVVANSITTTQRRLP